MLCASVALCAVLSGWLTNSGFDAPHRDAVLTYIEHESGFDPDATSRSGACLFQWAGSRRRDVLALGHGKCPPIETQVQFAIKELREVGAFQCFWLARSYPDAARMMRRGFGSGHC